MIQALSPEELQAYKERIVTLRGDLLYGGESVEEQSPEAEQHIIIALDCLSSAAAHLALAKYCTMQKR